MKTNKKFFDDLEANCIHYDITTNPIRIWFQHGVKIYFASLTKTNRVNFTHVVITTVKRIPESSKMDIGVLFDAQYRAYNPVKWMVNEDGKIEIHFHVSVQGPKSFGEELIASIVRETERFETITIHIDNLIADRMYLSTISYNMGLKNDIGLKKYIEAVTYTYLAKVKIRGSK